MSPGKIRIFINSVAKLSTLVNVQTFTFNPSQRLTFLSGENGSGKSAVLTALVFALGGNARVASRGNTNKAFIRTWKLRQLMN